MPDISYPLTTRAVLSRTKDPRATAGLKGTAVFVRNHLTELGTCSHDMYCEDTRILSLVA